MQFQNMRRGNIWMTFIITNSIKGPYGAAGKSKLADLKQAGIDHLG